MTERASDLMAAEVMEMTQTPQFTSCPVLPADLSLAPHASSCGHVMHYRCFNDTVKPRMHMVRAEAIGKKKKKGETVDRTIFRPF